MTCTCLVTTANRIPRINPQLPIGLSFETTSVIQGGYPFYTVVISGTPSVAQQSSTYSIGIKGYVSQFRIGIIGTPSSLSYGFDSMTQYVGVPIEPIPIRSDVYLNSFSIQPALPASVTMDLTTGTITGKFPDTSMSNQVFTVTGSNSMGSVTTTVKFLIRAEAEMTTPGFIGCYWTGTTECRTPAFDYYYQNPAQYCQIETKLDFADSYYEGEGNTWPGLDERFRDYYTSYMYGYFNVLVDGNYDFQMDSDDASFLYIDSLDEPIINRDGCRASGVPDYMTTHLAVGRHLFVVKFLEVDEAAILYLKFSSTDAGISQTYVDNTMTTVGGRGPTFITYPLITGYVNAELKVYTPEMSSGGANTWGVEPDLPNGMVLDTSRGQIRGKPTAEYNGKHTVTATGVNGVASTEINIVISSAPLPGFRASYYKIYDPEMCMYTNLAPSQMELKVVKTDSQINFPVDQAGVWSGLPTDLTTYYFAEWEGYLNFTEIGNWKIRVGCDDSCRVFSIEDTLQIDRWTCASYSTAEKTIPISSTGYYDYRIRYQQKTDNKGMVLEWQAPSGGWEVIPAANIFHIAPSMLSYDYERAHYFQNVQIVQNQPRLFYATSCSNYNIQPALPSGLSFNTGTGIISGAPTTEQVLTQYTITCTGNGPSDVGTLKTTIAFDVFYELPPTSVTITRSGSTVPAGGLITANPGGSFAQITISAGGAAGVTYSISPELPYGLSLNAGTGVISGTPYEPMTDITYTVTASNPGGVATTTFRLTVNPCKGNDGTQWTNDIYIIRMMTGNGAIKIVNNGNVAQCSGGNFDAEGNAQMVNCQFTNVYAGNDKMICIKPDANNKIEVTCNAESGCYTQIYRPDGNRFPPHHTYFESQSAPYVDQQDFPSALIPLTLVTLSVTETTVYTGMPMDTVDITPNGCYKEITVEPSLGSGFEMDLFLPQINTEVNGFVKTVYTITAKGDAGEASATLTVHFKDCGEDGQSNGLKLVKSTTSYGSEESYELYNSAGELVLQRSGFSNYATYTNSLCLPSGDYTVTLRDTYGDGWSSGAYLKVYDMEDTLLQEFTISNPGNVYTGYFTLTAGSSASMVWKILLDGRSGSGWNNVDFDDSKWASTVVGQLEYGEWQQNTIYARYKFSLTNSIRYPIVQFSLWYKDGVIVYLNGNEVYRRNMKSGSVSASTTANAMYEGYYTRIGSAPGYLLQDGDNVIAVEIHKHQSTSGNVQFRGAVNPLQGNCISRVDGGSITESSFFNQAYESSAQAWDRNPSTTWIENGIPAWTVYSYNFDRMEWVNKIALTSNSRTQDRDPTSWALYGSTDGVTWEQLLRVEKHVMFESRLQAKEWMMMDHMNSYSQYKFEMYGTFSGNNRVAIADVDIQSCQLNYCVKDGVFPGVMSDETSVAPCPEGFIGEQYRHCSLQELNPTWGEIDDGECRSTNPPKGTVYIDVAYRIQMTPEEIQNPSTLSTIVAAVATSSQVDMSLLELWKVKNVAEEFDGESVMSAFWIRFTLPQESAASTLTLVRSNLASIQTNLQTLLPDKTFTIEFYMNPVLQERKTIGAVSVALIIILVLLLLVIIAIASFYIWVRTKSKKTKQGAKQLRSGAGKVGAQHLSGKETRI